MRKKLWIPKCVLSLLGMIWMVLICVVICWAVSKPIVCVRFCLRDVVNTEVGNMRLGCFNIGISNLSKCIVREISTFKSAHNIWTNRSICGLLIDSRLTRNYKIDTWLYIARVRGLRIFWERRGILQLGCGKIYACGSFPAIRKIESDRRLDVQSESIDDCVRTYPRPIRCKHILVSRSSSFDQKTSLTCAFSQIADLKIQLLDGITNSSTDVSRAFGEAVSRIVNPISGDYKPSYLFCAALRVLQSKNSLTNSYQSKNKSEYDHQPVVKTSFRRLFLQPVRYALIVVSLPLLFFGLACLQFWLLYGLQTGQTLHIVWSILSGVVACVSSALLIHVALT